MICFGVIAVAHGWNMWRVFRREELFYQEVQEIGISLQYFAFFEALIILLMCDFPGLRGNIFLQTGL